MEGEPTWKRKRIRFIGRESQQRVRGLMFATHSGCGCIRMRCKSENCNSITNPGTNFCFTFDKVGVLEYSRNVTQKINL